MSQVNVTKVFDVTKALSTVAGQQLKDVITYVSDATEQLISSLRNGLTFSQNFDCQVRNVTLTHNLATVISANRRVQGIFVTRVLSDTYGYAGLTWYYDSQGQLTVKIAYTSTPTTALDVRLILEF
jgi:uncharacterized protein RhaS with RHS repeats